MATKARTEATTENFMVNEVRRRVLETKAIAELLGDAGSSCLAETYIGLTRLTVYSAPRHEAPYLSFQCSSRPGMHSVPFCPHTLSALTPPRVSMLFGCPCATLIYIFSMPCDSVVLERVCRQHCPPLVEVDIPDKPLAEQQCA